MSAFAIPAVSTSGYPSWGRAGSFAGVLSGSQLRHRIREALLIGACKSAGGRLPLKDHFMLIQGVAIGGLAKELSSVTMASIVE